MGTRHLTVFHERDETEICVMYGQGDGYPTGHGDALASFLAGKTLVNGYSDPETQINGMGCLAAMVVARFKEQCGGFYLHSAGTRDVGEEYIYHVYNKEDEIRIKLSDGPMTFFGASSFDVEGKHADNLVWDGPVKEFNGEEIEKKMNEEAA